MACPENDSRDECAGILPQSDCEDISVLLSKNGRCRQILVSLDVDPVIPNIALGRADGYLLKSCAFGSLDKETSK